MSWFSKIFSTVDKAANSINPLKDTMQDLTDSTVSKVYKPAGQLYDFSNSHPLESGLVMLGASAGASALGGAGATGDAGVAADAGAGLGGVESIAPTTLDTAGAVADTIPGQIGVDGTLGASGAASLGGIESIAPTTLDTAGAVADTIPAGLDGSALSDAAAGPGGFADTALGGGSGIGSNAGETAGNFISSGADGSVNDVGGLETLDSNAVSNEGAAPGLFGNGGAASTNWGAVSQDALKTALKYGPAGLSLMRSIMGQGAYAKAANAYGNVGATQRATANGLVQGYNNGTLNPAENAGIDKWATQQVAALRQFYANAGTADSTQAKQAEAAVMAQAVTMKNQASQNLLQVGLNELNSLDANTRLGIQTNLQGDNAATAAQANFAAQFSKLIGAQQSGTAATTGS